MILKKSDRTKKQAVSGYRVPKIEGHIRLDLYDAKTKEIQQTVEGKNLVTNAVADIFADNILGLTDYMSMMPIARNLFGGVLCFENQLTESASGYFLPKSSENKITAHAGQTSPESVSADPTRGQPIDAQTEPITNGFKFVWEFGTTQGNGTIKALALCPKDLGDWAMNGGTNFFPLLRLTKPFAMRTALLSQNLPQFYDSTNKRAFCIVQDGTSITVREFKNYSLQQDIDINQAAVDASAPTEYEDHTFTIANGNTCYVLYNSGNIIYMYASGTSVTRTTINTSTWTTSSDSFTVAGATFVAPQPAVSPCVVEIDSEGWLTFLGSSCFIRFMYSDLSQVISIDRTENNAYTLYSAGFHSFGKYTFVSVKNDIAYIIEGNKAHLCNTCATRYPEWDTDYTWSTDANGYTNTMLKGSSELVRATSWITYSALQAGATAYVNTLCKLFLSTIKNLESTVTKTSTQGMTITYTITMSQGE